MTDPLRTALDRLDRAMEATEGIPLGLFAVVEQVRRAALALRAALLTAIADLDPIAEMAETGGDIPTEVTIVQNALRAALADTARPAWEVTCPDCGEVMNKSDDARHDCNQETP